MNLNVETVSKTIEKLRFPFPYSAQDWVEHLYLENYHCHKDFSNTAVPDCAELIENYAERAMRFGTKCLFSGEHGSQGNQFKVYKVAEEYGLKYRHSAEAYWVKDRKEKDRANCHIMLIAKNPEGRKDINYILSKANEDGFYYQPRIDLELLLNVPPENIIVTSACVAGWKYEDADEIWVKVAKHFGNNFFLEVQNHNTDKQKELNKRILAVAKSYGLQLICGLDSHYVLPENSIKREQIQKYKKILYNDDEAGWYMDYPDTAEVIRRFEEQGVLSEEEILLSVLNTNIFVNECEDIVFNRDFKIPNIYPELSYDERVALYKKKINKAYHYDSLKSEEKKAGIRWEVEQLVESKTVDYPLMSEAIVDLAVHKYGGILTTTARGSAASFITNKYAGLTTIDRFNTEVPIYPERFLAKERVAQHQLPDVDLNLADSEPFVQAARELLGEHGCYPLMTLGKLKEKAAWQLYAGANGITPEESRTVLKCLDEYNAKLKHADVPEAIRSEDFIPERYMDIYNESKEYQGITINLGVHACGHLCYDGDIRRDIGLITAKSETTGERTLCACVEGMYLDEFGYVKEDFLTVDSVHLTHKLFHSIGMEVPSFDELKKMVDGDKKTWEIYEKGITVSVNQCEGESTTKKAMKYKPKSIAELSTFIAGIRPGFASLINTLLSRKPYSTGEPEIDSLLQDSAHFMIYQESIMKVLGFLGLPMGETYSVIKSISKKKLKGEKKDKLLQDLRAGWQKKFGNLDNFAGVWQVIEDAAAYSFNACVTGDTKIWGQKEVWKLYCRNRWTKRYGNALSLFENAKIYPNEIVDIRIAGKQDVYRVMTESGEYVDCTLNHKFPTPEKGLVKLKDLRIGDRLYTMPYVNKHSDGVWPQSSPIKSIKYLKHCQTYDVEMADPAHNFVVNNGLIIGNSHSYSMAGDSLYLAWFKAHHTAKFYEIAIGHYQEKNKKAQIMALTQEAMDVYGYTLGDYRFGNDNRRVVVDEATKTIYPNMSLIKGLGEKVVEALYQLGKEPPETFVETLDLLTDSGINKTVVEKLIKINYFERYGSPLKLLEIQRYFLTFNGRKGITYAILEKEGYDRDEIAPYGREMKSKIGDLNVAALLADKEKSLPDEQCKIHQLLDWEYEILGVLKFCDPKLENYYYVTEVKSTAKLCRMALWDIARGEAIEVKAWLSNLKDNPISAKDVLKIASLESKIANEPTGEINPKTGKRIYAPVEGKYEYWLKNYRIIGDSHA